MDPRSLRAFGLSCALGGSGRGQVELVVRPHSSATDSCQAMSPGHGKPRDHSPGRWGARRRAACLRWPERPPGRGLFSCGRRWSWSSTEPVRGARMRICTMLPLVPSGALSSNLSTPLPPAWSCTLLRDRQWPPTDEVAHVASRGNDRSYPPSTGMRRRCATPGPSSTANSSTLLEPDRKRSGSTIRANRCG